MTARSRWSHRTTEPASSSPLSCSTSMRPLIRPLGSQLLTDELLLDRSLVLPPRPCPRRSTLAEDLGFGPLGRSLRETVLEIADPDREEGPAGFTVLDVARHPLVEDFVVEGGYLGFADDPSERRRWLQLVCAPVDPLAPPAQYRLGFLTTPEWPGLWRDTLRNELVRPLGRFLGPEPIRERGDLGAPPPSKGVDLRAVPKEDRLDGVASGEAAGGNRWGAAEAGRSAWELRCPTGQSTTAGHPGRVRRKAAGGGRTVWPPPVPPNCCWIGRPCRKRSGASSLALAGGDTSPEAALVLLLFWPTLYPGSTLEQRTPGRPGRNVAGFQESPSVHCSSP